MSTEIYGLDMYSTNERNGTYGGNAGDKEGITINNEFWIVKYPKSTKGMRGDLPSYTSSPLSEYIGSHIYGFLGIDSHETILGVRNNKLVVCCKDFCKNEGSLREIRTLKNIYNKELSEVLDTSFSSTSDSHLVDIDEMLLHLKYNPILNKNASIEERFWDMFVIDILINNNDRNNGNWGLLYEDGHYSLAPVFDNGASFSSKLTDKKLETYLNDSNKMESSIAGCTTTYSKGGKVIRSQDIVKLNYHGLSKSIKRNVPTIIDNMDNIRDFIMSIPTSHNSICVCSDVRKRFYINSMNLRLEKYLIPVLKQVNNKLDSITNIVDETLDLTSTNGKGRR